MNNHHQVRVHQSQDSFIEPGCFGMAVREGIKDGVSVRADMGDP